MPNANEQRLYQIQLLIRAYMGDNEGLGHESEIEALEKERRELLDYMNYME